MKTIYKAILARLAPLLENKTLNWADWDKGQLKKTGTKERPDVNYPCALIRIGIPRITANVTDHIQDCAANITITLAFDALGTSRTSAEASEEVRNQHLEPYDVIADVYALLQGHYTGSFSPLRRVSQSEVTHDKLFVYQIIFSTEFEDSTADL